VVAVAIIVREYKRIARTAVGTRYKFYATLRHGAISVWVAGVPSRHVFARNDRNALNACTLLTRYRNFTD
jgi:hypothetical protein